MDTAVAEPETLEEPAVPAEDPQPEAEQPLDIGSVLAGIRQPAFLFTEYFAIVAGALNRAGKNGTSIKAPSPDKVAELAAHYAWQLTGYQLGQLGQEE